MLVGLLMIGGGAAAGGFGSLLGIGGGVLIVPLLTLGFGLPLREAVGVSLICVIMTSSAAAGVYLERHVANMRLGMTLELFTAIGALIGGSIAFLLDEAAVVRPVRGPAAVRRRLDGARPADPSRRSTTTGRTTPPRWPMPARRRQRWIACPGTATGFATSGWVSSGPSGPVLRRGSWASAAGRSRCR